MAKGLRRKPDAEVARWGGYRSELHAIRVSRGWTREELAAVCGCTLALVKKAERDPTSISLHTLVRMAYALGVAPLDLMPELAVRPAKPVRLAPEAVIGALRGEQLVVHQSFPTDE